MVSANRSLTKRHYPKQNGFSLIEILVGMTVGMLATLVIMQVFSVYEGQKRTTTGTADAQTNGSIALYTIQRDIQMAGFGLPVYDTENPALNCDPEPTIDEDGDASTPEVGILPVSITDGGTVSDSIAIRYGVTAAGGAPIRILNDANATTTGLAVDNNIGCQVDDIVLVSNGSSCTMKKVTALPDATHIRLNNGDNVTQNASLACLGSWQQNLYAVSNGYLQVNNTQSVAGIVNIQAQYGISDIPESTKITQWVDASGGTWSTPSVADRKRIKAVRIAVVARNGLKVNSPVTAPCSSTIDPEPTGLCAWEGSGDSPAPEIDLSGDPDWRYYRYRVFETIVPLRNILWSSGTL